ncbi:MAG: hypothetical protein Q8R02_20540 [Hyphomonadaceae bacterium]|nr:hypothetical protein [Hyphomonadaceae bacterium]
MAARFAVSAFAALVLAACQPPQQSAQAPAEPATPQQAVQPATLSEPLDPFIVSIDAQRWAILIDKGLEGVRETSGMDGLYDDQLFRADVALKSGAANLIELRNEICGKGLLKDEACKLPDFPAWTREPPATGVTVEQINERSQWLSTASDPFTAFGCEAGRKAMKDDLFCSVE